MTDFTTTGSQEVAQLQKDVAQAQGSAGRREPLTQASAGWVLPDRGTPPTPSGGAHIYGSGGQVRVRTSSGQDFALSPAPDPFVKGNHVADPAVYNGGTAPGSYSASALQQLIDAVASTNAQLRALLTSMRTSGGNGNGLINSS